jgi:hypothetical protein
MSREEMLAAATTMLAAALDPSPMPAGRPERAPDLDQAVAEIRAKAAKGNATVGTEADAATAAPGTQEARLKDLHGRPPSAKFTAEEAALYLNCSTALLRTSRWKKRWPAYTG